jgi:hypothetical protein
VTVGVLGLAALACAQDTNHAPLLWAYDLDGLPADGDAIVTVNDLADSTTYVLAGQPDVARPVIVDPTDADDSITAGTITVTGKDSDGTVITLVKTFTGGGGTGSANVTSTTYFKSVTSVITSALTGESVVPGTDTMIVGWDTTVPPIYCKYEQPIRRNVRITSVGSSTSFTALSALSTPFAGLAVNDIIRIPYSAGVIYDRRVVTYTDANNIVVDTALDISATTGYVFDLLKHHCGVGLHCCHDRHWYRLQRRLQARRTGWTNHHSHGSDHDGRNR